jgi:RNA polymerase sigma-70 factor (ECF subfamily)
MSGELEQGLALIDQLESTGKLDEYYLFHAARADLLRRLNCPEEAREAYGRALELTANEVEQVFLRQRLMQLASR